MHSRASRQGRGRPRRRNPLRLDALRHLNRPENWRVRNKLTAVVLIPGLLAGAMAVVSLSHTVADADDFQDFSDMARLQQPALHLVHALQDERDATAVFIAGRRSADRPQPQRTAVDTATTAYHRAAADMDTSDDPHYGALLKAVSRELRSLPALRASVDQATLTQSSILANYSTAIRRLMELGSGLASHNGDSKAASQLRSLNALSQALENTSRVRATLNSVIATGTFLIGQYPDFASAVAHQTESVQEFKTTASRDHQHLYADTVKGADVSTAQAMQERVGEQAQATRINADLDAWRKVSDRKLTLMREVETKILAEVVTTSSHAHAARESAALWGAVGLVTVFGVTGWVVTAVVQSMTRPLKKLRLSALHVAHERLPEALTLLRQADLGRLDDYQATPTQVISRDEIGEVAKAFDAMQDAAVTLVKDQAALRTHINGLFIHLSRRNQDLVGKLLREIGDLEQQENNPDHLARLFRLDHLATQMLRTDDSLLVLAGSDIGRPWEQPMPLADILLAASAEVDQYTRIQCRPMVSADITAEAVTDLVHLLAELMQNATDFSGAHSPVTVTCHASVDRPDELVITIDDEGAGMTPTQLDTVNHRLTSVRSMDPHAGQSMGLFVIGRLAAKHGVRVRLASRPRHGTTALVHLPRTLLATPDRDGGTGHDEPSFTGGPAAQHGAAVPATPEPLAGRSVGSPGPGASFGEDTAPVFASSQEWLAQRRITRSMHDASAPLSPDPIPTPEDFGTAATPSTAKGIL